MRTKAWMNPWLQTQLPSTTSMEANSQAKDHQWTSLWTPRNTDKSRKKLSLRSSMISSMKSKRKMLNLKRATSVSRRPLASKMVLTTRAWTLVANSSHPRSKSRSLTKNHPTRTAFDSPIRTQWWCQWSSTRTSLKQSSSNSRTASTLTVWETWSSRLSQLSCSYTEWKTTQTSGNPWPLWDLLIQEELQTPWGRRRLSFAVSHSSLTSRSQSMCTHR